MSWTVIIGVVFAVYFVLKLIHLVWSFPRTWAPYCWPVVAFGLGVGALLIVGHIDRWYSALAVAGGAQLLLALDDALTTRSDESRTYVLSQQSRRD